MPVWYPSKKRQCVIKADSSWRVDGTRVDRVQHPGIAQSVAIGSAACFGVAPDRFKRGGGSGAQLCAERGRVTSRKKRDPAKSLNGEIPGSDVSRRKTGSKIEF